jgi:hypothetical protein
MSESHAAPPSRGLVWIAWLMCGVLCVACVPRVARAACQWNLSGDFTVEQANGYNPVFHLTQSGSNLSGTANYNRGQGDIFGGVSGTINQSRFIAIVAWDPGTQSKGQYVGDIDGNGHMRGHTRDLMHPSNAEVAWSSPRVFICSAPSPTPAPGPAPAPAPQPMPPLHQQRICASSPVPPGFIVYQAEANAAQCGGLPPFGGNNILDIEEYDNQPIGTQLLVCRATPPAGWATISTIQAATGCGDLMTIKRVR